MLKTIFISASIEISNDDDPTMREELQQSFGNIDIYLFDQLLKGRFDQCKKIIDLGCGGGRNLVYFMRNGFEVFGVDQNPEAIAAVRSLSQLLSPQIPQENFTIANLEDLQCPDESFDLVICSAVLHFATDKAHFDQMLFNAWRVIKAGGYFFARLASSIGMEDKIRSTGDGLYLLPDGSERYLVDEEMLAEYTTRLGGRLFEPVKTTIVQNLRAMTTWCMKK